MSVYLVAAPDGTLYANTWSGRYFPNAPPPPGGFLIALKDTRGEGRADVAQRFGVTPAAGGTGGSGIALYHDALFADSTAGRASARPGPRAVLLGAADGSRGFLGVKQIGSEAEREHGHENLRNPSWNT